MPRTPCLLAILLLLAASLAVAQDAPPNPLDGKRFLSLEKLTGGERRDGTVNKINWVVKFKGRSFEWLHHDVIVPGTYEYDAATGAVKTGANKIDASYDAKTGVLTWAKQKYKTDKQEPRTK